MPAPGTGVTIDGLMQILNAHSVAQTTEHLNSKALLYLLIAGGLVFEAGLLLLIMLGNLTQQAGWYLAVYAALFLVFGLVCAWVFKRNKLAKLSGSETRVGLLIILFFAALFRVTVIFVAPTLSTDQFRYTWEGRLITLGFSPYRYAPNDPTLLPFRDDFWPLVQQKETASPYPPLAQLTAVSEYALSGESLLAPKIAAVLFDLLDCAALVWLLGLLKKERWRVILYAWCPLPIIEFGLSGHNDAPMLFFLLLAVGLSLQRKPGLAAITLGLACLAKFTPLFVLPLFLVGWQAARQAQSIPKGKNITWGWRSVLNWRIVIYPLLTLLVVIVGYAPLLILGQGAIGSILEYTGNWHDNEALLFSFLNNLAGAGIAKLLTIAILGASVMLLSFHPVLSQAFSLPRRMMLILGLTLLVASTVHPWYVTWIVILLPLVLGEQFGAGFSFKWWDVAWLLYSALGQLPYLTYAGDGSAYIWASPLEFLPLYVAAGWTLWRWQVSQRLAIKGTGSPKLL